MAEPAGNILLLGAGGQLGRELAQSLAPLGRVTAVTRAQCDLSDLEAVARLLAAESPRVIVNAAAYTAVDRAEEEPDAAFRLNRDLPEVLARWAAASGALLVDFSTDYIYDGGGERPWRETDRPAPLNTYGRSKLAGLDTIRTSGCRYLVFIVSWIYSGTGRNFPNTMLRLARENTELRVVSDQVGAPTPAGWIAGVVAQCIGQTLADPQKCGLYNLAPGGSASWFDFAREVVAGAVSRGERLRLGADDIEPVGSDEFPAAARRPANSRLDTAALKKTFAILPPDWRTLYREESKQR